MRRHGDGWGPVDLPPLPATDLPEIPVLRSLASGRFGVLDDLLFSFGFDQVHLFPLEPPQAGSLLLARAEKPFSKVESRHQRKNAALLGVCLAAQTRRQNSSPPHGEELALLFDLTRDLASAGTLFAAARLAAEALQKLLSPEAGAVVVTGVDNEPPVAVAWPESASGREAAVRAAETLALPSPQPHFVGLPARPLPWEASPVNWMAPVPTNANVGLAVGWAVPEPEEAARIGAAIQATLGLAADRIRAQRQREEDRLRAVVEGLPLGVALLAREGRVRLVNSTGRSMLEMAGAWPLIEGKLLRLGPLDLGELIDQAFRGQIVQADLFLPQGGRHLLVRAVPASQRGEYGIGSVLLMIDDVTAERRRKEQMAQAEKLSAMGVLISGIVHEINNPLASVLGFAQMLQRTPDSPNAGKWIGTLVEEARRCQKIVGNLLAFAHPRPCERQIIPLGNIAEKAVSLVAYPFRKAGIEAMMRVHPETPPVQGDPGALLQVLINLLTNALHALEDHSGPRRVSVDIGPWRHQHVRLDVSNTGPAIAPENLDRVFDPFFTTKPVGKGTGLGLSLVATIVRDHGGTIEVTNDPDQGVRFRMVIPCQGRGEMEVLAEETSTPVRLGRLDGLRVLVVDDEPNVASLLCEALSQAGAETLVADDGQAALRLALEHRPDSIICDINLPRLSGTELMEELRRQAPGLARRVLLSTGDPLTALAFDGQGVRVLQKPFDLAAVMAAVRDIVPSRTIPPAPERGRDLELGGPL